MLVLGVDPQVLAGFLCGWRKGRKCVMSTARIGAGIDHALKDAFKRGWRDRRTVVGSGYLMSALIGRLGVPRRPGATSFRKEVQRRMWDDVASACDRDGPTDWATLEARGAMRQAVWASRRALRRPDVAAAPRWACEVERVLVSALDGTVEMGRGHANSTRLLVALLLDPGNQATSFLGDGVQPLLDELVATREIRDEGASAAGIPYQLAMLGAVEGAAPRWFSRLLRRAPEVKALGPVLSIVRDDAVRQAVRLGARCVEAPHILLALSNMAEELSNEHKKLTPQNVGSNRAGAVLAARGLDFEALVGLASRWTAGAEEPLGPTWRRSPSDPPMDASVGALFEEATATARESGRRYAGGSDVLLELLKSDGTPLRSWLDSAGVDVAALKADVTVGLSES